MDAGIHAGIHASGVADLDTGVDARPHRRIWRMAGPAIVANSSAASIGMVDAWAIGHLPDPEALAAIGVAAFYFNYIFWAFGFLRMGTTGLVAQAFGRRDDAAICTITLRSLVIGLVIAAIALASQGWLLAGGNAVVDPTPTQRDFVATYFTIRIWAAPAMLVRITVLGFLIGTQRMRIALLLEIVLNLGNAGLTAFFVMGLDWGIAGAAAASVIAETTIAIAALALVTGLFGLSTIIKNLSDSVFWRWQHFRSLLSVNAFIFVRTLFLLSAFGLVWKLGIAEGGLDAAANQVLLQFMQLAALGLDGIAYATEAEVGRALGARNRRLLDQMVRLTFVWAGIVALLYVGLFWLGGPTIIAAFTEHDEVRALALDHLPWLVAMPAVAVWSYQYDGIFIGATAGWAMMATMMVSFAGFAAACWVLVPRHGNHGLWAALTLFMAARGLSQAVVHRRVLRMS